MADEAAREFFYYANNEPKSAVARDLGDCRDNKGKLAKRVFTCFIGNPDGTYYEIKGTACLRCALARR